VVTPCDLSGIAFFPEDGDGNAVDDEFSLLLVDDLDNPLRFDAVEKTMDASIRRILLDDLGYSGKLGDEGGVQE